MRTTEASVIAAMMGLLVGVVAGVGWGGRWLIGRRSTVRVLALAAALAAWWVCYVLHATPWGLSNHLFTGVALYLAGWITVVRYARRFGAMDGGKQLLLLRQALDAHARNEHPPGGGQA